MLLRGTDGKTCQARLAKEITMFGNIIKEAKIEKL